jgi:hypothetical protein
LVTAQDYYQVSVTRKDNNLYKVENTKFYVQTQYCYEYAYSAKAILRIDSTYGYTIGKLIFDSGTTCDVKAIL